MAAISRSRRAEIRGAVMLIRVRGHTQRWPVAWTVTAILRELSEVSALEAWRFAYGWTRARVVSDIVELYEQDGLRAPALNTAMLCRWEHGQVRPSEDYARMLARVYRTSIRDLGLGPAPRAHGLGMAPGPNDGSTCYRSDQTRHEPGGIRHATGTSGISAHVVTTDALRAIRESIELAVAASEVEAGEMVREQVADAVEYYGLNYSKFAPALLFDEVRRSRAVVADLLATRPAHQARLDLRRAAGWLSALLGNLAFHLDDHAGARTHLGAAVALGREIGDTHLRAWSHGAQSMVARYEGRHPAALEWAERGLVHASTPLLRAQLLSWAQLPALAALGRRSDADQALAAAMRGLESAPDWATPGRFGFDPAELELHAAEASLVLDRPDSALEHASASAGHSQPTSPGWAAANLTMSLAESRGGQHDLAAERALLVLDRMGPERLRSTSRRRLAALARPLAAIDAAQPRMLLERLQVLPPLSEDRETRTNDESSADPGPSSA
jgi:hypothetical protein